MDVMDALVISPRNTMQKVVPIEGCAKFAVEDIGKLRNIRGKGTMKTLIPKKTNQKK